MIKRRFASSAFATMLNLIIQFSISFFLTSYIVETLGEEEYGFFFTCKQYRQLCINYYKCIEFNVGKIYWI